MKDEALRLALEALENDTRPETEYGINTAITILKQALEQPEPEPVVRIVGKAKDEPVLGWSQHWSDFPVGTEFYTSPPKREWQGLTADELNMIGDSMRTWNSHSLTDVYVAIEAKLKEKNT